MFKNTKCILLCGKSNSGKTETFCELFLRLNDSGNFELVEKRRLGRCFNGEDLKGDFIALFRTLQNKYIVLFSSGDAARYIFREETFLKKILSKNHVAETSNFLYVVAAKTKGDTLQYYFDKFEKDYCLALLKYRANENGESNPQQQEADNRQFASLLFNLINEVLS